jgi:hypothetical protein
MRGDLFNDGARTMGASPPNSLEPAAGLTSAAARIHDLAIDNIAWQ